MVLVAVVPCKGAQTSVSVGSNLGAGIQDFTLQNPVEVQERTVERVGSDPLPIPSSSFASV